MKQQSKQWNINTKTTKIHGMVQKLPRLVTEELIETYLIQNNKYS